MVVYRLVGRTNPLDWASMAEDKTLGLFATKEGAERKANLLKSQKHWHMDWQYFTVVEDVVLS